VALAVLDALDRVPQRTSSGRAIASTIEYVPPRAYQTSSRNCR
jgi:hypothetical protein